MPADGVEQVGDLPSYAKAFGLTGQVALVTGAGSGIGRLISSHDVGAHQREWAIVLDQCVIAGGW